MVYPNDINIYVEAPSHFCVLLGPIVTAMQYREDGSRRREVPPLRVSHRHEGLEYDVGGHMYVCCVCAQRRTTLGVKHMTRGKLYAPLGICSDISLLSSNPS